MPPRPAEQKALVMRFQGQLLIPSEQGPGLTVDLEVADRQLTVVSNSEMLGAWPLKSVRVRRIEGDRFAVTVAGEDLHFVADDTISFAYDGIQAIEGGAAPTRSRFQGLRRLFGVEKTNEDEPITQMPSTSQTTPDRLDLVESRSFDLAFDVDDDPGETLADSAGDRQDVVSPGPEQPPGLIDLDGLLGDTIDIDDQDRDRDGSIATSAQEEPSTEQIVCKATRNDGQPCESPVVSESGYCYPHDPATPVGRVLRDVDEARLRLKQKRAERLTRVYARLDRALKQVERGEMETEQAMAMAQLARTMCAILELDEGKEIDEGEASFSS